MTLWLLHPAIEDRDCGHCLLYQYGDDGQPRRKSNGELEQRHHGCPPPCRTRIGCPKGTPEDSLALSDKNRQALRYHLECKAVGQFPDDELVRQNGLIIEHLTQQFRDRELDRRVQSVVEGVKRWVRYASKS